MKYYVIVKDNIVIDKIVGDPHYNLPHDLIIEDINRDIQITAIYNPDDGTFSKVGNPYAPEEE